jgi:hypothetical protein
MNLQHINCQKLVHIAVNVSQNKTVVLRNKKSGHQPHIMEEQVNSILIIVRTLLCVTE